MHAGRIFLHDGIYVACVDILLNGEQAERDEMCDGERCYARIRCWIVMCLSSSIMENQSFRFK